MDFYGILDGLGKAAVVGTDVLKWINDNLFSKLGGLSGVLKSVIDFFKNLFSGDGGGIGDFFKGLFG